jgi:hypothetical protein
MQNAADAGAMAGARVLALGGTEESAAASAQEYTMTRNGADISATTVVSPNVQVTACESVPMTFARIVAVNEVTACARAAATYGGIGAMGGLAPIAVYDFGFSHCDPNDPDPEECTYTIWDDDKDVDPVTTHQIQGGARGWLCLNCGYPDWCQCGANLVKEWMRDGYPGVIEAGDYIPPKQGTVASAIKEADVGQVLMLPVWDHIEELDGKDYYHIIAFAAFKVTKVHATGNPKGITGIFQRYVFPNHPVGPVDVGLRTANLTE